MNRLSKDKGLANYVVGQFFHLIMNNLIKEPDTNNGYESDNDFLSVAAEP
jgi:hypothetical protein